MNKISTYQKVIKTFNLSSTLPTRYHLGHNNHYNDVIMSTMASQIISLTIVYSTVYSGADEKKTSKLRVTDLCEGNSPVTGARKRPVTRKLFPFDDVIMIFIEYTDTRSAWGRLPPQSIGPSWVNKHKFRVLVPHFYRYRFRKHYH